MKIAYSRKKKASKQLLIFTLFPFATPEQSRPWPSLDTKGSRFALQCIPVGCIGDGGGGESGARPPQIAFQQSGWAVCGSGNPALEPPQLGTCCTMTRMPGSCIILSRSFTFHVASLFFFILALLTDCTFCLQSLVGFIVYDVENKTN
jgi:hypothetical protein